MKIIAVINKQEPLQEDSSNTFVVQPQLLNTQNQLLPLPLPFDESNRWNLKEKDDHFVHLQELIESKKKILLDNQQKLKKISNQNHFLEDIKKDYVRYNSYILKQKREQMQALSLLNEYIRDLSASGELSEQNIRDSHQEQKKIMKELKGIQKSLDLLID
jgi:hypothetical protein